MLMHTSDEIEKASRALRGAVDSASNGLVDRAALVDTIMLSAVAGEHMLMIGPPGTAKSEAARRVARAVGGSYFEYLLGRFTEPSEIFGPVDLRKLREGVVETETSGMLPEAEIAFLDEVFLGSTAILNTLLGILNERVFRRGHTVVRCPLRICIGASNALPEDDTLAAFADRFLVRSFIEPIADPQMEELLAGGWNIAGATVAEIPTASIADLEVLAASALHVNLDAARPQLAQAIRTLRRAGIMLSDRRAVKAQKLMAAAAVLDGRIAAEAGDLWTLVLAVPTREEQTRAREVLGELLVNSRNTVLTAVAEEASLGPLARAARIVQTGRALLGAAPENDNRAAWELRLEGVAREIDATFTAENMPAEVAAVRAAIVTTLQPQSEVGQ